MFVNIDTALHNCSSSGSLLLLERQMTMKSFIFTMIHFNYNTYINTIYKMTTINIYIYIYITIINNEMIISKHLSDC